MQSYFKDNNTPNELQLNELLEVLSDTDGLNSPEIARKIELLLSPKSSGPASGGGGAAIRAQGACRRAILTAWNALPGATWKLPATLFT